MSRNPIQDEMKRYGAPAGAPLPEHHIFAHEVVRSRIYDVLQRLGVRPSDSILSVGCGAGDDIRHILQGMPNVVGADISVNALRGLRRRHGVPAVCADAFRLPFATAAFDHVVAVGILHHLVGQGDLTDAAVEFLRVARPGGLVVTMEPNLFWPTGPIMNLVQMIRPGLLGLVPHERTLSPLHIVGAFKAAGLAGVQVEAASFVYNRFPLGLSQWIARHEARARTHSVLRWFGWWEVVAGRKPAAVATTVVVARESRA